MVEGRNRARRHPECWTARWWRSDSDNAARSRGGQILLTRVRNAVQQGEPYLQKAANRWLTAGGFSHLAASPVEHFFETAHDPCYADDSEGIPNPNLRRYSLVHGLCR